MHCYLDYREESCHRRLVVVGWLPCEELDDGAADTPREKRDEKIVTYRYDETIRVACMTEKDTFSSHKWCPIQRCLLKDSTYSPYHMSHAVVGVAISMISGAIQ